MTRYVLKRLLGGFVMLLVISVLVFVGTNTLPGDPAYAILGRDATPERVADIRAGLHLDQPLPERYARWLLSVAQGDLGHSVTQGGGTFGEFGQGTPVSSILGRSVLNTVLLASLAFFVVVTLSLLVGTFSALRRSRREDTAVQIVTLIFIALPEFVLGALLVIVFAFAWPILPAVTLEPSASGLVLPVVTLLLGILGVTARLVRIGVVQVLDSNYVAMARLRGVPERRVIRSHVFPNSLGPTMQVFAMVAGDFVGAIVVVEYLFGYPGVGTGFVAAISGRDYPTIQAFTLVFAGTYIVANMLADIISVWCTPKMRTAITS